MSVSGSFFLPSPLPANRPVGPVPGAAFTFSDGRNTINNFNVFNVLFFEVGTDALGHINTWSIDLFDAPTPAVLGAVQARIGTIFGFGSGEDSVWLEDCGFLNGAGACVIGVDAASGPSGSWSDDIPPVATPLPAALPLFATGLGVLGLLGWRRKRKAQAAA